MAHDARAIWTAVQQPGVKTVAIKSEEQQAILALHRMRQQLVKFRTAQINGLRGLLTEYGEVMPKGRAGMRRDIPAALERVSERLPAMVIETLREQWARVAELDKEIGVIERRIKLWHRSNAASRKIAEIPGVGKKARNTKRLAGATNLWHCFRHDKTMILLDFSWLKALPSHTRVDTVYFAEELRRVWCNKLRRVSDRRFRQTYRHRPERPRRKGLEPSRRLGKLCGRMRGGKQEAMIEIDMRQILVQAPMQKFTRIRRHMTAVRRLTIILPLALLVGCVQIPPEAIELNSEVSKNIAILKTNNLRLIATWETTGHALIVEEWGEIYESATKIYNANLRIREMNWKLVRLFIRTSVN